MNLKNKIINFILNIVPILLMIGLISVITNDYILTAIYAGIIIICFLIKREKGDILIFVFGFFGMILSEMVFISTGVETFIRNTLLGLMPLWLPFLWGYGFVVIKRGLNILGLQAESEQEERPKMGIGIMIFKDGKVLLGKRRWRHGDGEYSFPGGHLEYMQSFEDCARRETLDEVGIKIKNIKFQCVSNTKKYFPKHYLHLGLTANWESGEPRSLPDERIIDWAWYNLDDLPEPMFFLSALMVEAHKTGQNYFDLE